MRAIDSHTHLDDKIDGSVETAARYLSESVSSAGIDWALVLHLEAQPWSAREFIAATSKYDNLKSFVNVDPRSDDANYSLEFACKDLGFLGLKLHPRLQQFQPDEPEVIKLCQHAGMIGVPVLIDAFPDGTAIIQGFNLQSYIKLAQACPETNFIWAHMGAHYVLDFMLVAKRLPNIYFDCSYSLLYFRGSHVPQSMIYAMKSMRFERVFYGSDYPDRSIGETLELSLQVFRENGVTNEQINKVFYENAHDFFSSYMDESK